MSELREQTKPYIENPHLDERFRNAFLAVIEAIEELQAAKPAEPTPTPAKPTEGEWWYNEDDDMVGVGNRLRRMWVGRAYGATAEDRHANGRLFAASKEMIEFLEDYYVGNGKATVARSWEIIKKARGL